VAKGSDDAKHPYAGIAVTRSPPLPAAVSGTSLLPGLKWHNGSGVNPTSER